MKYNVLRFPGTSIAPIWVERSSCRHIWLLTRGQAHIYLQHTHTYTYARKRAHTHSQNAPILLHNPNLSESTLCFPLGFPPLLSAHLFLSAAASPPTPSLHASLSSLLSSTYPLLHSSSACSFSFFQICAVTDEPSSDETNSKPNPSVIF